MKSTTVNILAVSIVLLAASFASPQAVENSPLSTSVGSSPGVVSGDVDLSEALALAMAHNFKLAEADATVNAANARIQQAGAMLNPELEFELENFAGRGELEALDGADATIMVTQPIRLGGDRSRRRSVARAAARLASGDFEIQRRDLVYRTTSAFYQLIAAQQEQVQILELLDLARNLERTVDARVEAGKVSPVELTRARIETVRAEVAAEEIRHRLRAAKARLAVNWNATDISGVQASGDLPLPESLPPYVELERRLIAAPELELMRRHQDLQVHSIELEKALAIPDIRVSVGSRQFRVTGTSAWVAGVSMPLPLFDRNQGNRDAAEFELERSQWAREALEAGQFAQLRTTVERYIAAEKTAIRMADDIEPAASQAFAAVEIGYLQGKFAFADLLLAQQSLFESRRLVLESRLDFALARCELERLVGPLSQTDNAAAAAIEESS